MKFIPLSGRLGSGTCALVDDEYHVMLSQFRWRWTSGYAVSGYYEGSSHKTRKWISAPMHRVVMNAEHGQIIDHVNGNRLDNRKCNLRLVTNQENLRNMRVDARKTSLSTSRFKGVARRARFSPSWAAKIMVDYKFLSLGSFKCELAAALAYNTAALRIFGSHACINPMTEEEIKIARSYDHSKHPRKKNTTIKSKYRGVSMDSATGRWFSYVIVNKRQNYAGSFVMECDAAMAYNKKAKELLGDAAILNEVEPLNNK